MKTLLHRHLLQCLPTMTRPAFLWFRVSNCLERFVARASGERSVSGNPAVGWLNRLRTKQDRDAIDRNALRPLLTVIALLSSPFPKFLRRPKRAAGILVGLGKPSIHSAAESNTHRTSAHPCCHYDFSSLILKCQDPNHLNSQIFAFFFVFFSD